MFKRQSIHVNFQKAVSDFEPFFLWSVKLFDEEPEAQRHCPHKHDLLTLLSVGGHWVTTEQHLQVSNSSFFKTELTDLFLSLYKLIID